MLCPGYSESVQVSMEALPQEPSLTHAQQMPGALLPASSTHRTAPALEAHGPTHVPIVGGCPGQRGLVSASARQQIIVVLGRLPSESSLAMPVLCSLVGWAIYISARCPGTFRKGDMNSRACVSTLGPDLRLASGISASFPPSGHPITSLQPCSGLLFFRAEQQRRKKGISLSRNHCAGFTLLVTVKSKEKAEPEDSNPETRERPHH